MSCLCALLLLMNQVKEKWRISTQQCLFANALLIVKSSISCSCYDAIGSSKKYLVVALFSESTAALFCGVEKVGA
jgi:ethanolamine ammonia-lyase large subunit